MKVLAGLVIAMALVIGIVPQFANCEAQGGKMAGTTQAAGSSGAAMGGSTMNGAAAATAKPVPKMKCLWTARAALGIAIPLLFLGALMLISRGREAKRVLAIPAAVLGVIAMLIPTVLIGVCVASGAVCRTTTLPTMLLAGGVTVAASLAYLVWNEVSAGRGLAAQAAA